MAYVYDPSQKRSVRINSEEATAAGFQTCPPRKVPLYTTGECVSVNSKAYQAAGLKLRKEGSVFVERDNKWEEMCVSDKVKCCTNQIPSPKTGACINSNGPSAQTLNIKVHTVDSTSYVAPKTSALWTAGDLPEATIFPETYVPGGKAKSMSTRLNPGKVAKSPRRRSVKGRRRSVKRPTLKKQTAALTDLLKKIDEFAEKHMIDVSNLSNPNDLDLELKDKALHIFEILKKENFDIYNVRHLMFFRDIIKPKMMNVLYAVLYHKLLQFVSSRIQVEYHVYLEKALHIPAATMKKELENFMSWVIQSTILSGNSALLPQIKALSELFEFKFSSYLEALTQAEEPINVIAGYAVESNIIIPDEILLKRLDSAPDYNSKSQQLANTIYTLMKDADRRVFRAFLIQENLLEQPKQPSVISATAVPTERSVTPPTIPVVSSVVSPVSQARTASATSLPVSPVRAVSAKSSQGSPARAASAAFLQGLPVRAASAESFQGLPEQSAAAAFPALPARLTTPPAPPAVSPALFSTVLQTSPALEAPVKPAAEVKPVSSSPQRSALLPVAKPPSSAPVSVPAFVAGRSQSLPTSGRRGTPRSGKSPNETAEVEKKEEPQTPLSAAQFAELAEAAAAATESTEPNYVEMLRFMFEYLKNPQNEGSYLTAKVAAKGNEEANEFIKSIKQDIDVDVKYREKEKKDRTGKMTAAQMVKKFKQVSPKFSKEFKNVFEQFKIASVDPTYNCRQHDKRKIFCINQPSCIWEMKDETCHNKFDPNIVALLMERAGITRAQRRAEKTINPGKE